MKRWLFLVLIAGVLAGCSGRTLFVANVDVLSFVDAAQLEGDLNVAGSVQAFVPDADGTLGTPDGGELIQQVPVLDRLEAFELRLSVETENTGAGAIDVDVGFHLAPASDSVNIYDGVDDVQLAQASLQLAPGERRTFELDARLESGDAAMALITQSGFRVGVQIQASGTSTVHYRIAAFELLLKQRPFDLIPDAGP